MKIGIFGAGAVGGFLGAKLAETGQDVHFIARDNQMKAMRLNGLTVKSEAFGNTYLAHPQVTDKPEEIGVCDVVFLTVKLYDSDEAIKMMKPLIGAGTVVVSFQNGLTAAEPLMKAFGSDMILGGVAYTISFIETPGIIHQVGRWRRFVIGRFAPGATAHGEAMEENAPQLRAEAIKDVILEAGLEAAVSDNIWEEIRLSGAVVGNGRVSAASVGRNSGRSRHQGDVGGRHHGGHPRFFRQGCEAGADAEGQHHADVHGDAAGNGYVDAL